MNIARARGGFSHSPAVIIVIIKLAGGSEHAADYLDALHYKSLSGVTLFSFPFGPAGALIIADRLAFTAAMQLSAGDRHGERRPAPSQTLSYRPLTTSIAQAEEAVVRYQLAMQQQSQNGSDPSRTSALLRMAEERVALLRRSCDRVLVYGEAAPPRRRRRVRSDPS